MINQDLKKRIIQISYKNKLSHLGSCLTAVDIIDEIFTLKKYDEKFILSSGHAGLALYCVLEKYTRGDSTGLVQGLDAEEIFEHHGVHPDRCKKCQIDCSTGSLGHGLGIAVGMALNNRDKNVYCLISDGESSEGSIWEALRIAHEQRLYNLHVYINCNGWGAYKPIDRDFLIEQCKPFSNLNITFRQTNSDVFPFLKGLDAHYYVMNESDYIHALEEIE